MCVVVCSISLLLARGLPRDGDKLSSDEVAGSPAKRPRADRLRRLHSYTTIHRVHDDVVANIDVSMSFNQLHSPEMAFMIVQPLENACKCEFRCNIRTDRFAT